MDELALFHFLRPYYLLMIPVFIGFTLWLYKQQKHNTGFEQWIDKKLLPYISKARSGSTTRYPYLTLCSIWIIATVALAGPTWQQLPQPLHESESAMVIVLDLSPSMLAEDNKPSRIIRAQLKIKDLLNQRKDGLTALVVYAGEAYVVTPLTSDTRTISNLLSTLKPGLLPIPGSNIEMAISLSKQLVSDAGLHEASVVIVTDGIHPNAFSSIRTSIGQLDTFILGIGTQKGAPIPTSTGFLKNEQGKIINVARNEQELQQLANSIGGTYLPLQANDSDIRLIINNIEQPSENAQETERNIDQWYEFGPTLLLVLIPFLAGIFRRGWLLTLIVLTPALLPETAYALSWDDLWLNKNQRGQQAFEQKQYDTAAQSFTDSQWKGSAAYRNKDYATAADAFAQGNTATDHYNRGNALAHLGQLDEAIKAYDTALDLNPNFSDAEKNRSIVENLQQQQNKQENKQQENEQQQNDQNSNDKQDNSQSEQKQNDSSSNDTNEESSQQQSKQQNPESQNSSSSEQNKENTDQTNPQQQNSNLAKENEDKQEQEDSLENGEQPNQSLSHLNDEEKQALEQWIRKIPDDPSGLLRRKFEHEYQKRRREYNNGQWQLPDNDAHTRY